jgi:hypothetical protein
MKSIEDKELPASPIQGVEMVHGEIEIQEVWITIEEDNELMPTTKDTSLQLLPTIF